MYGTPQRAVPRRALGTYGPIALVRVRPQRFGYLAAITPDAAAQTAMPSSSISKKAGFTQDVYNGIVSAAGGGQIPIPGACGSTKVTSTAPALAASAQGILLSLAPLVASPAAPFVLVGAAIAGLFSAIFGAHAAAVKKEQQLDCAAVPAANETLTAIDQAVKAGTITPAQGISALQNLLTQFQQQVAAVLKMNSSQCNAACVYTKQLQAIVAELTSQYQDRGPAGRHSRRKHGFRHYHRPGVHGNSHVGVVCRCIRAGLVVFVVVAAPPRFGVEHSLSPRRI